MTANSLVAGDGAMGTVAWVFVLVSAAEALAIPTTRLRAQIKFRAFMAGEFSMPTAKSHARNQSFFMARVMRLPRLVLRVRNNATRINTTAAASSPAPMASAPWRLKPEVSPVGARTFVCVSAILGGGAFVGITFVEFESDSAGGGGFAFFSTGGGLAGTARGGIEGTRLVPTFVPI